MAAKLVTTDYGKKAPDYRFIDKDPIVDVLRTKLGGKLERGAIDKLAADARLAPGTIMRIFYGETRRPQNYTVDRLLAALGYRREIVKD